MKILIICSKKFYPQIAKIKEKLEEKGHVIELPNTYYYPNAEKESWNKGLKEHTDFKTSMFRMSKERIATVDAVLVLNFDKNEMHNYIGGSTFLEIYEAFCQRKKIYLYHAIPSGILYDEISAFNPIVLEENLDKIETRPTEQLRRQIERYVPYNEQEEVDRRIMLQYIDTFDNVLTRDNELGHFTASAWVVNKEKTKILMIYHNIYQSWAWTGGHADGEEDLLGVAIRELKEETGVKKVKILKKDIYSLENVCVNGHIKKGKYVGSHMHLNLTYLLEVEEDEVLKIKQDENSGVKWVPVEDVLKESNEKWISQNIYQKLNEKIKRI